ncbi:MAG TPA: CsbD family protein, partial [Acidimicrobiia bacterium]
QQAKGKAKESTGRATGNRSLKNKGKTDRAKAKTKKAAERVKDRLR